MITRPELETYRSVVGFNAWQIERDYLQHLVLLFLSRHTKEDLVFKGGTALHKAYALGRFSIDLDFTVYQSGTSPAALAEHLERDLTLFGYPTSAKRTAGTRSDSVALTVAGPLYRGRTASAAVVRLEISSREPILLRPVRKEITPVYPDVQPYTALVMDLREILSEKIRAIMTRSKPRDIFDAKFILDKGYRPDVDLVNKKLSFYSMTFSRNDFKNAVRSMKPRWEKEMKLLLSFPPPAFETVARPLLASL